MNVLEIEKQIASEVNEEKKEELKNYYHHLTPYDRVLLARHPLRPKASDYIEALFDDFYELHGDRYFGDDGAIIGGIATFKGRAVTIIAEAKGKNVKENIDRNFGMPSPEGYRKALRLAKQAEKFHRPIINIVDTAGAYPGKEAEERGQAEAIARCLYEFSDINTPIISIVISEGGSGGALALSVCDSIMMLENATYSILSPEGFASILWKDDSRVVEAANIMKLTAKDLLDKKIIDHLIDEPLEGVHKDPKLVYKQIERLLETEIERLMHSKNLLKQRYERYRNFGRIS